MSISVICLTANKTTKVNRGYTERHRWTRLKAAQTNYRIFKKYSVGSVPRFSLKYTAWMYC